MAASSVLRFLARWRPALYVAVPLGLYLGGWHTEVLGRTQQALLATGLYRPRLPAAAPAAAIPADYSLPLRTLDGRLTTLAELRGRVILLNIWATWCPPCIAEMPGLQRLHDKLRRDDNVSLVLLAVDEKAERAQRFVARRGFTMPIYTLAGPVPAVYESPAIPITFIIAPNGTIVARHEGMGNYDTPEVLAYLRKLAATPPAEAR